MFIFLFMKNHQPWESMLFHSQFIQVSLYIMFLQNISAYKELTILFLAYRIHVVFGHVISGQEVVRTVEAQKVDPQNRPFKEVVIANCGELVPQIRISESVSAYIKICFYVV